MIVNRTLYLIFITISTLFFNCSNNDYNNDDNKANNSNYSEMIQGKWIVEYQWHGAPKQNYEDYIGLPESDPDNTDDYTILSEETTFLFRADQTVFVHEWGEEYTKEYYFEGNKLYFSGWEPEDTWLYKLVYNMTNDYFIARKSCSNNNCDDDTIFVRYYRRIE